MGTRRREITSLPLPGKVSDALVVLTNIEQHFEGAELELVDGRVVVKAAKPKSGE